ncbi:hypothetical protein DFR52_101747 [Hoeflea marina]|uniref:Uncharacterized protein n=2 Tax=Hoeflea marina TaxID=274592 RepID=A0A317PT11_9HYPH|nr:hypothetical protein DFR52_101747 [Hoeflea marina]
MDLVATPPGGEWSGRARYAAAMYFYQRGEMPAEVLEVYRISSRLDAEDAVDVLRLWQIGTDWIARIEAWRAAHST